MNEETKRYTAKSVYDALCTALGAHAKLHGTGKYADLARFDLAERSVRVGRTYIVRDGKVAVRTLVTNNVSVEIPADAPWMTDDERSLDPAVLHEEHYRSVPTSSDGYAPGNFPAAPIDDLTDEEMVAGMPRCLARVRLEAWILCASADGTLKAYVDARGGIGDGKWFWSDRTRDPGLCVLADWLRAKEPVVWKRSGRMVDCGKSGSIELSSSFPEEDADLVAAAPEIMRMLKRLVRDAFAPPGRRDLDNTVNEASSLVERIENNRKGNMK